LEKKPNLASTTTKNNNEEREILSLATVREGRDKTAGYLKNCLRYTLSSINLFSETLLG
jgi:hypothetical protein